MDGESRILGKSTSALSGDSKAFHYKLGRGSLVIKLGSGKNCHAILLVFSL